MKKFLMIAIAALALMACGEKNKYDTALDEFEKITDEYVEAIKSGDEKAAQALDQKLTDLGSIIAEIDSLGTDEQKMRKQTLAFKLLGSMMQAIDTTKLNAAFEEAPEEMTNGLEKSANDFSDQLDKAVNKAADEISGKVDKAVNKAADEVSGAIDKALK